MIKLYDKGVYLVNQREIIEDSPEAIKLVQEKLEFLDQRKCKQGTMAFGILESHNESGNMEHLNIKFDKLISHDITLLELFRPQEPVVLRNSRYHIF